MCFSISKTKTDTSSKWQENLVRLQVAVKSQQLKREEVWQDKVTNALPNVVVEVLLMVLCQDALGFL